MIYLNDIDNNPLTINNFDDTKSWDVWVSPDYDSPSQKYTGISIAVGIPELLNDGNVEQDTSGYLIADLSGVFEEYLKDVFVNSGGECLQTFIDLLDTYSHKAREKLWEINGQK